MTTQERVLRMIEHKEADRIPITDTPWRGTLQRWQAEGMPADAEWDRFFDVDLFANIGIDNSPRYPEEVLEETEEYRIVTTPWGVTIRERRGIIDSTPEFLGYKVNTPDAWREAKARMVPTEDRVDWAALERNYRRWRQEGRWITGTFWFGYDVLHSWMAGMETVLIGMMEDPEWIIDMVNHYLDTTIALFDKVWERGYHFDSIFWYDDMGYKHTPFFSRNTYRTILQPAHRRAVEWAHAHGIKAELHSCGFIEPLLPDILDCGIDVLNPVEVKAGMDPVKLKGMYGDRLTFHGGVNAVLWDKPEAIEEEIRRVVPLMKQNGGYIFSSDHSIPNTVSLADFRRIVALVKEVGRY